MREDKDCNQTAQMRRLNLVLSFRIGCKYRFLVGMMKLTSKLMIIALRKDFYLEVFLNDGAFK